MNKGYKAIAIGYTDTEVEHAVDSLLQLLYVNTYDLKQYPSSELTMGDSRFEELDGGGENVKEYWPLEDEEPESESGEDAGSGRSVSLDFGETFLGMRLVVRAISKMMTH